jgi:hypothetical protein
MKKYFEKPVKFILSLIIIGSLLLLEACCGGITGIAPSTTPITSNDTYTVIGPASGSSFGMNVTFFPINEPNPSTRARERALKSSGGDALIEVVEDFHTVNIVFIIFFYWTNVRGTAVKIQRGGAEQ